MRVFSSFVLPGAGPLLGARSYIGSMSTPTPADSPTDPTDARTAIDDTTALVRVTESELGTTIVLDRPERRNALTLQMWIALGDRLAELADGEGPIYLVGAGGYFCSGADLSALAFARTDEEHAVIFVRAVVTALMRLHRSPREVVAVIDGGAAGGGIEIMACCHRRVALGDPKLVFPFGHHGMTLDGLTHWSLIELLGEEEAERLIDGRHVVEIEESLRLGLFDERHEDRAAFAGAEAERQADPQRAAAGSAARERTYLQPGEAPADAVTRAATPMLTAFPPHRTF